MKRLFAVTAAIVLLGMGLAAQAIDIETVTVRDVGNQADTRYLGWGSVGYTYNIGKYEVTTGQYTEFLNAVAATDTYGLYNSRMWSDPYDSYQGCRIQQSGSSGSYTYSVASDWANRPVNYVSWGDSARFANWLHNRQPTGVQGLATTEDGAYYLNGATTNAQLLAVNRKADWRWAIPSEDEWYKAAYYKGGSTSAGYWDYPTRSDTAPGRDMADASGNNANISGPGTYPIDSGKYTTVVGEFQDSDSPYGTFDQGGNVAEWNEAVRDARRGQRGGAYNYDGSITLRASNGLTRLPTFEDSQFGFRVSAVPEPSSLIALAGGLVGLLGMRRRRA